VSILSVSSFAPIISYNQPTVDAWFARTYRPTIGLHSASRRFWTCRTWRSKSNSLLCKSILTDQELADVGCGSAICRPPATMNCERAGAGRHATTSRRSHFAVRCILYVVSPKSIRLVVFEIVASSPCNRDLRPAHLASWLFAAVNRPVYIVYKLYAQRKPS